jgi:hypothetical protein
MIGTCQVFPSDNPWNTDISNTTTYPDDPNSANYMNEMNPGGNINLHPDFGSNPTYGIPINIVTIPTPGPGFVPITFTGYPSESDPGPYPIPSAPAIEAGSDHHMLIVDQSNCTLYETWEQAGSPGSWSASNGAIFHLNSDAYRPDGWTSADAAGLPIAAGLVRYGEVQAGAINHAVRFTMNQTYAGQILPARHHAGSTTPAWLPPMGTRLRLKASYDISSFTGNAYVILVGLKKYGMILADNGTSFYITGETNTNWNDTDLNQLKSVPASALEVLTIGPIDTTGG